MARPKANGDPPRPTNRCKFTDMFVRNVKPEPKPYFVYDIVQRGLVLRCSRLAPLPINAATVIEMNRNASI